jgi:hypothetical protein
VNGRFRLTPINRWLEPLLCVAITAAIIFDLAYLYLYGYLPQPFFYVPEDTFMDWFNTAYWSHHPGAYDAWGTIYPPLSFDILRFLTDSRCYVTQGYPARACDTFGLVTLHLIFLMNCILVWKTFRKIDRKTALCRSFALCAGLPMLFALERGNLLLLCFTFVLLAFGPLVKSARLRWIAVACAINLKVYLIGTLFGQLLRRKWRWFEGAILTTVLVYLLSFSLYGEGNPYEVYRNIIDYVTQMESTTPLDLWYSNTYRPLLALLNGTFPVTNFVGSYWADVITTVIPILIYGTQAVVILAALGSLFRPAAVPQFRVIYFTIAVALVTSEAGGYTQVLLLLFVFMEEWKGVGRKIAIFIGYLLSIPADIPISSVPANAQPGFMGLRDVITQFSVGLMPFLRPGLIMIMTLSLAVVTLRAVWCDARANGWRSPWTLVYGSGSAVSRRVA